MSFKRRKHHDEVEGLLRRAAPVAPPDLVESVVRQASARPAPRAIRHNRRIALGFATVLTAALVAPLAAFGGFTSAASSVKSAALVVKHAVSAPKKAAAPRRSDRSSPSPAHHQYAQPSISTSATASAALGESISDSATLSGGADPTGTITFTAYGPDGCSSGAVFSSSVAVNGNGSYGSGGFTPTQPGTYSWAATYSGDANNQPAASPCGAHGETSTVTGHGHGHGHPSLHAGASSATLGQSVGATASLADGSDATGTITFTAYSDGGCSSAAFSSTSQVNGDGSYSSGGFTPSSAGTYNWVTAYSGDSSNDAASTACGAASSTVTTGSPTSVTVRSLTATAARKGVVVRWRTGSERTAVGFNVYRAQNGHVTKLNGSLIHAAGTAAGRAYSWLDRSARNGTVTYRIEAVTASGARVTVGTVTVAAKGKATR